MKAHILIVEDEAILYKRLKKILIREHFSVDDYTPSAERALEHIHQKRPDIVLLDIQLEGAMTGIDLGKILHETYGIPFIYITGFDDDQTFYESLNTNHENFIVKTKPVLNDKEVIRAIQTTLKKRNRGKPKTFFKDGVMGLVTYLSDMKEAGNNQITKVPVKFDDISFFTVKPFVNENNELETLKANYLWFLTINEDYYFLRHSLRDLTGKLPYNFIRINESYIVNISPQHFKGQVNDSKILIGKKELRISDRNKRAVKERIQRFYQ